MGLLKNRVRTIIGEETNWYTATSSILFYLFHPARYRNKAIGLFRKMVHPAPAYGKWIEQQEKSLSDTSNTEVVNDARFIIISPNAPKQSYVNIVWVKPEHLAATNISDAYLLYIPEGYELCAAACEVLAGVIQKHQPDIITFDVDHKVNGVRRNPRFMPAWSPVRLWFDDYLDFAVCVKSECIASNINEMGWVNSLRHAGKQRLKMQRVCNVLLSVTNPVKETTIQQPTLDETPLVSIIIPTRNKSALVQQCIDSILEKSSYRHYEIILVDNNSDEPALEALVSGYQQRMADRFCRVKAQYAFNFSKLINDGAAHSKGAFLILLNNDTEIKSADWIEQLLLIAGHPLTGAVGAKLLYPDNTVQHAGIVLSKERISRHIYLGEDMNHKVYDNALNTVVEYSALTAACLLVSRSNFERIGGFNTDYKVEYNDLDFCLRLQSLGLHNVFTPHAVLYHYESASRQHPLTSRKSANQHYSEKERMFNDWQSVIVADPYHHPHRELFQLE